MPWGKLRDRWNPKGWTQFPDGWSPEALSPLAWYEPRLSSAGQTLTDLAGANDATLGSAAGSDTNDPNWIEFAGDPFVVLPGSAGNTISCVAPANTASYRAVDTAGSPTTGAAAAGAFVFQTAGSWVTLELLNAGATVLARFQAESSSHTGHVDSFSVTWTINRATSGRKSVLVKESLLLLGTDDYVDVPAAAFGNHDAGNDWTVVAIFRQWATPGADAVIASSILAGGFRGFRILNDGGTTEYAISITDSASASVELKSANYTVPYGTLSCFAGGVSGTDLFQRYNAQEGATASVSGLASGRTGESGRIGTFGVSGSNYGDFEFFALLTFDRALTSVELDQLFTHYQGVFV